MGEETLHRLNRPVEVNGHRTSALRTTDLRVLAVWHLLVWFVCFPAASQTVICESNSPGNRRT